MIIGTCEASKNIDNYCINTLGIPGIVLMENAAIKVLNNMDLGQNSYFAVICGKGNNGGDGLALGKQLITLGKRVEVFLVGDTSNMSNDCNINLNILVSMGIKINIINSEEDTIRLREVLKNSDVTIDAIFGTGLKRNVEGIYDLVISVINENSLYVISIDIPSGMDTDSGKVLGNCIKANKTISFVFYKRGFLSYGNHVFSGDIIVENIGIPYSVIKKFCEDEQILNKNTIKSYMRKRDKYAHKGTYGKAIIVAGSKGYTGAAYISTQAAVKSGAGLVTLCTHKEIQSILSVKLVEAMTESFNNIKELIKKADSIAIGPGMGSSDNTLKILRDIIMFANVPIVIDADGLNVLENNIHLLKSIKSKVIITPHLGEMSRLTKLSIEYIKENRIQVAKEFAKKYKIVVLLKGYNTIITDGYKTFINSTGNSAMASGGMGDCLTGIITSFISQGYEPMKATAISAFIHGYCGDKLSQNMFCVDVSPILNELSRVIKEFI